VIAGEEDGKMHLLGLENDTPGASIVTAWNRPHKVPSSKSWRRKEKPRTAFGCPDCLKWFWVSADALGKEITCPQCGNPIQLNPFVIEADFRPVAKAWGE